MSRDLALWLELLAGPLAWFASLCANFALAPWACSLRWQPALHVVSFAAMLVTAASGSMALSKASGPSRIPPVIWHLGQGWAPWFLAWLLAQEGDFAGEAHEWERCVGVFEAILVPGDPRIAMALYPLGMHARLGNAVL